MLILSLFPGIGLFDRAFEEAGACVVRGPDLLWGGDIRRFHPPGGRFDGLIGGPPCQDFSVARRAIPPTGEGLELLAEFVRVVSEAQPAWFLCENVPRVPDIKMRDYAVQRVLIEQAEFVPVRRKRCFQFGRNVFAEPPIGPLEVPRGKLIEDAEECVTACDKRSFADMVRLQGLPADFDLPSFTDHGRRRAVGNGVPLPLGRIVVAAVFAAIGATQSTKGPDTLPAVGKTQQLGGHDTEAALEKTQFRDLRRRCPVCSSLLYGKQLTCSNRCRLEKSRIARNVLQRRIVED